MNQKMVRSIFAKGPLLSTVRDVMLLTCSLFSETHFVPLKKIFGVDFSFVFWYTRPDGNVVFYRVAKEYQAFAKAMGERCRYDARFLKKITTTLVHMTDTLHSFLRKHRTQRSLVPHWQRFSVLYRDFFAYHQAVCWASEYLTDVRTSRNQQQIDRVLDVLHKAYKYNEQAVPEVERYFLRLKINHLAHTEIAHGDLVKSGALRRRSIVWTKQGMCILSAHDADALDRAIRQKQEQRTRGQKQVRGLPASPGVVRGRVRLITNLRELATVKKGQILVTTQTRPQYNTVMRRAAAIVTDEGGLLCHASMLAREFLIPCIVGTKTATGVFHTGDFIEVDAGKGIVHLLRRG